jgi:hypothetical protein
VKTWQRLAPAFKNYIFNKLNNYFISSSTTNYPLPDCDISFLIDLVNCGGIDYSFIDTDGTVDFRYLCQRFSSEDMTELTDKIKDTVTDWLYERENEEDSTDEDCEDLD